MYEDGIEKSVPPDHCLSSFGRPCVSKQGSLGQIFLLHPHTHDGFLKYDFRFLLFYNQNAGEIELENNFEDKEVTVAKMWKNLAADEKAAYSKIASLENSNDSIHLSDDLRGLDLKPLSRTGQEGWLTLWVIVPCIILRKAKDLILLQCSPSNETLFFCNNILSKMQI